MRVPPSAALALLPALALGACAAQGGGRAEERAAKEIARAIEGRVAGEPVDCVMASRLRGPQIVDSRTILYRESGRRLWRNDLPDNCPFLRPDRILIVELHGSNLCRNDLFSTLDRGSRIPAGKCRLGKFTPYDKPRS